MHIGNHIFVYDSVTGYYHHYCHMRDPSPLSVGDSVNRNTIIGIMGATGNVTGPHLHYEIMINSTQFVAENFIDPTIWLGIPNQIGTYDWQDYPIGPTPPTPTPVVFLKKKKFPWVLYARKIRNRY